METTSKLMGLHPCYGCGDTLDTFDANCDYVITKHKKTVKKGSVTLNTDSEVRYFCSERCEAQLRGYKQ